jgi:hypothetical protein
MCLVFAVVTSWESWWVCLDGRGVVGVEISRHMVVVVTVFAWFLFILTHR